MTRGCDARHWGSVRGSAPRRTYNPLILAAAIALAFAPAAPAHARSCTPIRATSSDVIGGQEVTTRVVADQCGRTITVIAVLSATTGRPYRVTGVDVTRYRYDGSRGGARVATIPGTRPGRGHRVPVWVDIPARGRGAGWSGYVTVRISAGGETRAISLHL